MAKRKDVCDTEESCRQKASARLEEHKRFIKTANPEMDDFCVLKEIYNKARYASCRARENLERGHYARHVSTPKIAIVFESSAREAVHIMDLVCQEMRALKNAQGESQVRVNCTSKEFQSCTRALRRAKKRIPVISDIIDREILPLMPDKTDECQKPEAALK